MTQTCMVDGSRTVLNELQHSREECYEPGILLDEVSSSCNRQIENSQSSWNRQHYSGVNTNSRSRKWVATTSTGMEPGGNSLDWKKAVLIPIHKKKRQILDCNRSEHTLPSQQAVHINSATD